MGKGKSYLWVESEATIWKDWRFVKKNPEFTGVFNEWKKLFDADINATLIELNAFRSSTPFDKIKELNITNDNILIKGDSQLVIYQYTGRYSCHLPHLYSLREHCINFVKDNNMKVKAEWVRREFNTEADKMTNDTIKPYIKDKSKKIEIKEIHKILKESQNAPEIDKFKKSLI